MILCLKVEVYQIIPIYSLLINIKSHKIIYEHFKDKYDGRKFKCRIQIEKIHETRNYFLEERKQRDLTIRKHKKGVYL